MTDDEWEAQRKRAILAALQTGRPVFADNDGELRYVDGDGEPLVPAVKTRITWWARIRRWFGGRS